MIALNKKISTRQVSLLFIMITLSPAIRLFPQYTAKMAGKAGWLAPLFAIVPVILLIYITDAFFKKHNEANLSDVYFKILGNAVGRIVIFIYLLWMLVLLSLYVRYYAERLLSSILPDTSISFLIITMLFMVFIAVRCGIVPIARANEVFFGMFLAMFFILFIIDIPNMRFRNLMNVSYLDAWPVLKASSVVFTVWGYFPLLYFFGDMVNDKEHIKKIGLQGVIVVYILSSLLLIMTIGTLGAILSTRMSLPFFIVVKEISLFGTIERLESVLLALWVISDFVIIIVFTYIAVSLLKSIFKLSEIKTMVSPVVLITGIGAMYLAQNRFELERFSTYIGLPVNTVFEFAIPGIVYGIGKIRKKI